MTLAGTVESVSGSSLTLKTSSGSTVTVQLGDSTTYHGQTAATASDVTAGKEVLVQVTTGAASSSGAGSAAAAAPSASGTASSSAAPAGVSGTQPTFTAGDVTIVGQ